MGKFLLPGILAGVGLGVALLSIVLGFVVIPMVIDNEIVQTVQLRNGSDSWEDWIINPVPVYLKFYIWNVTNPDAVERRETPILSEKGPYVFSEIRAKNVTDIDEESDTITYRQSITYFFEEELSKDENGVQLSLDDLVNVVNLPYIVITTTIASLNVRPVDQFLYNLYNSDTFVKQNVTVGQVLFDGWEYPRIYSALLLIAGDQPQFAGGKFGYYRGMNGSNDGEYVVKAGLKSSNDVGRIVSWEGQSELSWWDTPRDPIEGQQFGDPKYCNQINGTDGGVFPPFLTKKAKLPIFTSDICRSVSLEFTKEEEHLGITGYKYEFPESFYEHPNVNPDNYCFCPSPEDAELEFECARGVIRLFDCQGGPLVTSSPHFYNGDEKFLNKLIGMNPDKEKHGTYLLLQPDGGFPLKIRKRVQMSLEIQNFNNSFNSDFNDIDYLLLPALWASEETELNEELANEIKGQLLTPMKIVDVSKWVLLSVGGLLFIVGVFIFFRRRS